MTTTDRLIAEVLAAAAEPIVGRVRLQKIFYLLEQRGLGSGLRFHYHHYGPYSRELDGALDRAQAVQGVEEKIAYRQVDGMPYSIFSLREKAIAGHPSAVGGLAANEAHSLIGATTAKSSTVLELAATIHWLKNVEKVSDWKKELVRRKGAKTEKGRMEEAIGLLEKLGLSSANLPRLINPVWKRAAPPGAAPLPYPPPQPSPRKRGGSFGTISCASETVAPCAASLG